jgi:Leucine-rich repeat (LRR) protein/tRNA A-37 threonylcarbamoyl transferase component Bud32
MQEQSEVLWDQGENKDVRMYGILRGNERLVHLTVSNLQPAPEHIEELGKLLLLDDGGAPGPRIRRLVVNQLQRAAPKKSKEGIAILRIPLTKLFVGLRSNSVLLQLRLVGLNMSDGDLINLCRALELNRALLLLDLTMNPFLNSKGFGLNALCTFLRATTTLRTLVASQCSIVGPEGGPLFDAIAANRSLVKVVLSDNPMGECFPHIVDFLRTNRSVVWLEVAHLNDREGTWKSRGVGAVLAAVADSDTLVHLDVSGSSCGDSAMAAFGLALARNRSLRGVVLASCAITDSGIRALMDGLTVNCSLSSLGLRSNRITAAGAARLLQFVLRSVHINRVDIWENAEVDASAIRAFDQLYTNKARLRDVRAVLVTNDIVPDFSHFVEEIESRGQIQSSLSFHDSLLTAAKFERMCNVALCNPVFGSCMASVQTVDCRLNSFRELPQSLSLFSSVATLVLCENRLSFLAPSVISSLTSLTYLDLRWNELSHLPDTLAALPLQTLLLSNNPLQVPCHGIFSHRYTTLDMAHTSYADRNSWVPRLCQQCANFEDAVDLSNADLQVVPSEICGMTSMRSLDLSGNRLAAISPSFSALVSLTHLDLSRNSLVYLPHQLGSLRNLASLRLEGNPIVTSDLVSRPAAEVTAYLRSMASSMASRLQQRVVVVGPPSSGKSSVIDLLRSQSASYLWRKPERRKAGGVRGAAINVVSRTPLAGAALPTPDPRTTDPATIVAFGTSSLRRAPVAPASMSFEVISATPSDSLLDQLRLVHSVGASSGSDVPVSMVRFDMAAARSSDLHEEPSAAATVRALCWEVSPSLGADSVAQFLICSGAAVIVVFQLGDDQARTAAMQWVRTCLYLRTDVDVFLVGTYLDDRLASERSLMQPLESVRSLMQGVQGFSGTYALCLQSARGVEELYRDMYARATAKPGVTESVPSSWLQLEDSLLALGREDELGKSPSMFHWITSSTLSSKMLSRVAFECGLRVPDTPAFMTYFERATGIVKGLSLALDEVTGVTEYVTGARFLDVLRGLVEHQTVMQSGFSTMRRKPASSIGGFFTADCFFSALVDAGATTEWVPAIVQALLAAGLISEVPLRIYSKGASHRAAGPKSSRVASFATQMIGPADLLNAVYDAVFAEMTEMSEEVSAMEKAFDAIGEECIKLRFGVSDSDASRVNSIAVERRNRVGRGQLARSGRWLNSPARFSVVEGQVSLASLDISRRGQRPSPVTAALESAGAAVGLPIGVQNPVVATALSPVSPAVTAGSEAPTDPSAVSLAFTRRWFTSSRYLFVPMLLPRDRPAAVAQQLDHVAEGVQVVRYVDFNMLPQTLFQTLQLQVMDLGDYECLLWRSGISMSNPSQAIVITLLEGGRRLEVVAVGREVGLILSSLDDLLRILVAGCEGISFVVNVPCTHCLPPDLPRSDPTLFLLTQLEELVSMGSTTVTCKHPWNAGDPIAVAIDELAPDLVMSELANFLIDCCDLNLVKAIAKGSRSVVYEGEYKGRLVAAKRVVVSADEKFDEDLAAVFRQFRVESMLLSRLRHENIVEFCGIMTEPVTLVMEFMPDGNLYDKIRTRETDAAGLFSIAEWSNRFSVARQVARGLAYMHAQPTPVIHRDLKSANVLLRGSEAKVSDFGLSVANQGAVRGRHVDNPFWLAVEVIRGEDYTTKSDVYSFGVILWELLTMRRPYSNCDQFLWKLEREIVAGLRPEVLPEDVELCPADEYVQLMRSCWDASAGLRPSFEDICFLLDRMSSHFE